MKIDIAVPEWAEYRAQDSDGTWCFFSSKPIIDIVYHAWDLKESDKGSKNRIQLACIVTRPKNYKTTMRKITDEDRI